MLTNGEDLTQIEIWYVKLRGMLIFIFVQLFDITQEHDSLVVELDGLRLHAYGSIERINM